MAVRVGPQACYLHSMRAKLCPLLMALCLVGFSSSAADSKQPAVSDEALRKDALVIDVRTAGEFKSGHVSKAINVPIDELDKRIEEVAPEKGKLLVVHCQSGGRSAKAARLLERKGYTNVHDLGSLAHARQVIDGKK